MSRRRRSRVGWRNEHKMLMKRVSKQQSEDEELCRKRFGARVMSCCAWSRAPCEWMKICLCLEPVSPESEPPWVVLSHSQHRQTCSPFLVNTSIFFHLPTPLSLFQWFDKIFPPATTSKRSTFSPSLECLGISNLFCWYCLLPLPQNIRAECTRLKLTRCLGIENRLPWTCLIDLSVRPCFPGQLESVKLVALLRIIRRLKAPRYIPSWNIDQKLSFNLMRIIITTNVSFPPIILASRLD